MFTWRNEVVEMLYHLQGRLSKSNTDREYDVEPSLDITLSTNAAGSHWAIQTGDNSFTGACYGDPHWAVGELHRDTDVESLVDDLLNQLSELIHS